MVDQKFHDPHPDNLRMVLSNIGERDKVLDIGAWWKPFTRANYVVDYLPYETRGRGGKIGSSPERFSSSTWFQMDMCRERLPFNDKEIDFVYCGQTLEDVRDPLWVCEEMIRVGKRGYIEVPSVWIECQYGIDTGKELSPLYPGYQRHRWLVMIKGNSLTFIPKQVWLALYKFIPEDVAQRYKTDHRIWSSYLMWDGEFQFNEMIFSGQKEIFPVLKQYFDDFDYSLYCLAGVK